MTADDTDRGELAAELRTISDEQLKDLHRALRQEWKRRGLGRKGSDETGAGAGEERVRRKKRGNDPAG